MEQIVCEKRGDVHANIQVVERGSVRFMRFGAHGGWQGAIDLRRPARPLFAYQRAFKSILRTLSSLDVGLFVGVGTGTGIRSLLSVNECAKVYAYEYDQVVLQLAKRHFSLPWSSQTSYFVGDATSEIYAVNHQFDIAFVDAYMRSEIYQPVLNHGFTEYLMVHASENSSIVFNLIYSPLRVPNPIQTLYQRAHVHGFQVLLLPLGFPFTNQNVMAVLTRDRSLQNRLKNPAIYRQDHNVFERLFLPKRLCSNENQPVL